MQPGNDPRPLSGRTALVTGAGRGVGRGIALALAQAGARVAVNDLHPERAAAVAAEVAEQAGDALPLAFDVTDEAAVRDALARLREQAGGVDVLVHNAGVLDGGGRPNRFADMPVADWRSQLELNLAALMLLAQQVLPHQVEQGWGRIVQISSGASAQGLPIGVAAYGAAKAGGEGLMRHLAVEYGPHGVTANSLALGLMEGLGRADEPRLRRMIDAVPVGRLGTGADVGAAVLWLASEPGGYTNGQVIHLNGGTVFGR